MISCDPQGIYLAVKPFTPRGTRHLVVSLQGYRSLVADHGFCGSLDCLVSSDLQTCPDSARFVATIPTRCIYLGRFCTLAHPAHQPSSIRQVIPTTTRLHGLLRHRHSNQLTIPPVELQPCTSNPFIPFASHGFIGVDSTTFKVPLPRRPPTSVRGKYPTYLASNWNGRAHSHRIMDRDGQ